MTKINLKKAFTLVELLVSVAVFSIVMVVATSALLNVIDANRKAQSIKTAINNVNFALESISKEMRVGTDYSCLLDELNSDTCVSEGNVGVKYLSSTEGDGGATRYISYLYNAEDKVVKRMVTSDGVDGDWEDITSEDIDIIKMKFYVTGLTPSGDLKSQPYIVITLTGEAGAQEKVKTTFDLQTSVSQRVRVNNPTP